MKYVTYLHPTDGPRAGFLHGANVVDLERSAKWMAQGSGPEFGMLPSSLLRFLELGPAAQERARQIAAASGLENQGFWLPLDQVKLLPPLPLPRSFRDFYAFEEHVKTARGRRGLEMVPQWYKFPVFYFSNHNAIHGPDEEVERPAYTSWLDYELEIACVIGKEGRSIPREEALDHIAGFTILNDWSARDVQREEVTVGLGPAKGKDFATSIGPYLLTPDELEDVRDGERWSLAMTARVNGKELSRGNFADIWFSFAELIARASDGVTLYPGDLIGSGTVGTGCILELGEDVHRWLEPGDLVELEIERLGTLRSRITKPKVHK